MVIYSFFKTGSPLNLLISLFIFIFISFFEINFSARLAEIFFAICGVLFSVGMSLIFGFDLGKIADKEIYEL